MPAGCRDGNRPHLSRTGRILYRLAAFRTPGAYHTGKSASMTYESAFLLGCARHDCFTGLLFPAGKRMVLSLIHALPQRCYRYVSASRPRYQKDNGFATCIAR